MSTAMTRDEFELHLRAMLDELFDRDPVPGELATRFFAGEASFEEFCAAWRPDWLTILTHNRFLYPLVLEKAPDFLTRMKLVSMVDEEYGCGELAHSHAFLSRRFFAAVGATEEELVDDTDVENATTSGNVGARIKLWKQYSWIEMLTALLWSEVFAPPIFSRIIELATNKYGLSREDMIFFVHHAELDVSDADRTIEVVADQARTAEDQQRVLEMVKQFARDAGGPWLARHEGTTKYRFAKHFHATKANASVG